MMTRRFAMERAIILALATDCRLALDAYPGMARLVLAQPPAHAKAVAIADATLGCLRHGSAPDARLHQIAELLFLFVAATSTASTAYVAEGRPGDRTDDFLEGLGAHVGLEGTREERFATELELLLDLCGERDSDR